jgi:hypothetical protein
MVDIWEQGTENIWMQDGGSNMRLKKTTQSDVSQILSSPNIVTVMQSI